MFEGFDLRWANVGDGVRLRVGVGGTGPAVVLLHEDDMQDLYGDVLAVWQPWAEDLPGQPITSGHHIAEDAPEALSAALISHFVEHGSR